MKPDEPLCSIFDCAADRMKPDEPLCSIFDCAADDESEGGISISTAPRATAQARYASEYGIAFQEVQCLRIYVHIYTRQEAWDEYGRQHEIERRQDVKGVGWYFAATTTTPASPGIADSGFYYDDPDENGGLHQPISAEDQAYIDGVPTVVPDNWDAGEEDPAWFPTTKNDPRAIPAWHCSEF